ncbi:MAG: alpha/beta hydrolase, partial [Bacteroidota bacterium]
GDGHPVLVLPGFMTGDSSTRPLRKFLRRIGYDSYGWNLGRNTGGRKYVFAMIDRINEIYDQRRRKVSIIGWSLGGVYAREVARRVPNKVRQVITMGSPFIGLDKKNNISWLYEIISGENIEDLDERMIAEMRQTPPVPVTAIYSKSDGVVPWEYCMENSDSPNVQNIQVKGSHCGLAYNVSVLSCIADRLEQEQTSWEPFRPNLLQRVFYPSSGYAI